MGAATGFLVSLLLWRYVGEQEAGLFFLALTCRNVAAAIGKGGFDRILVRTVAAYAATEDSASIHGAHRFAIQQAFKRSLIVATILAALAWPLANFVFHKPMTGLLVIMALTVIPAAIAQLSCASIRGLKHTATSQFIDSAFGPLAACLLLPVFASLYGVEGAAIGRGLALVCAASLAWFVWRRVAPPLQGSSPRCDTTELTQASQPLLHTDLMNLLMTSLPMLLLGYWQEATEAGIYGIALRTAMLIAFIQMGLNAILGPKFAAMWKLQNLDELRDLARKASWLAFFTALPFAALFCFAPAWVLSIFSERAAVEGSMALILLTISQLVNVASGPVGSLLVMSGHQRMVRNGTLFTVALQLALCIWLIPTGGAMGAAIAAAVGVTTKNLINVVLVRKYLGVRLLFG